MIAIIDYKMGNLRSVENALKRLGAEYQVTADADIIRSADRVLLPGVGNEKARGCSGEGESGETAAVRTVTSS